MLAHISKMNMLNGKDGVIFLAPQLPRYVIWPHTTNTLVNKILDKRIYDLANQSVILFFDKNYTSSIALAAIAGEMLSYLIFFVHNKIYQIQNWTNIKNNPKFLKHFANACNEQEYNLAFLERGDHTKRLNILEKSKINKTDYESDPNYGNEIQKIVQDLKALHTIRIKYTHHWKDIPDETYFNDAKSCITYIHHALGDFFEMDARDEAPGVLHPNLSAHEWMNNFI